MKGIIIYKTKYGSTKQYAEWLSSELSLPLAPAGNMGTKEIEGYDFLVIGTPVYDSRMLIGKWLKKNKAVLGRKKIFLFIVSGTQQDEQERRALYIHNSVPGEIRSRCNIYFLQGRMELKKLPFLNRWFTILGSKFIRHSTLREKIVTDFDRVDRANTTEMVNDIWKYISTGAASLPLDNIAWDPRKITSAPKPQLLRDF